jgi:hypothetical protein
MRDLRIAVLLLLVAVGTEACIVPVPVGPGWGGHHPHHHDDWR